MGRGEPWLFLPGQNYRLGRNGLSIAQEKNRGELSYGYAQMFNQ
jgi:hypothetical protein